MTTIKLNTSPYVAEHNPHLFEDGSSAQFEIDALSNGEVDLYLLHANYQPKHVRDFHAKQYDKNGSAFHKERSERQYQWAGVELTLTPKQARKLARALKLAAKGIEAESRG